MNPTPLYPPNCIPAYSGTLINLIDPQPETIYVIDIAIGLARECRFSCGAKKNYSVAEHSVWGALIAEEIYPDDISLPFKFLLHDAHEYALKDIPTPLKQLVPRYYDIAQKFQQIVHKRYGVSITHRDRERIDQIDQMALEWENENKVKQWTGLAPLNEMAASNYFIHHFMRLCKSPYLLKP